MSDISKIKVEDILYNVKDTKLEAHKIAINPHNITAATIGLDKVENLSKEELKEYIEQGIDGDLSQVKKDVNQLKDDVDELKLVDKDKLDLNTTKEQTVLGVVNFNKNITIEGSDIYKENDEMNATNFWNFPDGISIRGKEAIIDAEAKAIIAAVEDVECNVTVTDGVASFFFKLPKGQDNVGPKGEKGSKWISSELLIGTLDFYTTELTNVGEDDWGINPNTGMFYRCVAANDKQQLWNYMGTFAGPQGEQGEQGIPGEPGEAGAAGTQFFTSLSIAPSEEETEASFIFNDIPEVKLNDYVINTMSQVMYKCITIDEEENKIFSYSMNLGGQRGAQGETGPQGEPGPEGPAGVSPTVTVYSETDEEYILTITDVNNPEGYQTPNLKDGGTKIEPNPEEDATDTLNKIKIKDTVYELEGGAASGVYVGDDEPEEDNVSLWIDTSEDYPSGGSGSGSSKHKYSTDEQIVGEWIDGKPIYEKVFRVENYIATEISISEPIDFLIETRGICIDENDHYFIAPYGEQPFYLTIYYKKSQSKIIIHRYNPQTQVHAIILRYTKITN